MDGRADGPTGGWSCVFWSGCNGCRKVVAVTKPGDHFDLGFPRPVPLSVRQRPAWCFPTPLGARSKRCLQLKMKHARNTAVPNPLSVPKRQVGHALCVTTLQGIPNIGGKENQVTSRRGILIRGLLSQKTPVLFYWNGHLTAWKCPHCNLGIPAHFSSQVRREARIRHGKSKHPEVDQKVFHAAADPECFGKIARRPLWQRLLPAWPGVCSMSKAKSMGTTILPSLSCLWLAMLPKSVTLIGMFSAKNGLLWPFPFPPLPKSNATSASGLGWLAQGQISRWASGTLPESGSSAERRWAGQESFATFGSQKDTEPQARCPTGRLAFAWS